MTTRTSLRPSNRPPLSAFSQSYAAAADDSAAASDVADSAAAAAAASSARHGLPE